MLQVTTIDQCESVQITFGGSENMQVTVSVSPHSLFSVLRTGKFKWSLYTKLSNWYNLHDTTFTKEKKIITKPFNTLSCSLTANHRSCIGDMPVYQPTTSGVAGSTV